MFVNRPKLIGVKKKLERREAVRERKALSTTKLERSIEAELIERLKSKAYGDAPLNVNESVWQAILDKERAREKGVEEGVELEDEETDEEEEIEEDTAEYDGTGAKDPRGHVIPLEEMEAGHAAESPASPTHARSKAKTSVAEGLRNFFSLFCGPVFVQAFILTFLGEWGDRSQISTIALGAAHVSRGVLHVQTIS